MFASKLKVTKPPQSIQKAVSPKPAKVGKQPGKTMGVTSKPKTKSAKPPSTVKGKKITGFDNKSKLKGKPVKNAAVKGMYRSK